MTTLTVAVVILGGLVAGVINTLAGSGSAITLSILTELIGLPGTVANATNRIGVGMQSAVGSIAFRQSGRLDVGRHWLFWTPTVAGAFVGIALATMVDDSQFRFVFRALMLLMLVVVLVRPKKWLRATDHEHVSSPWLVVPLSFALGVYGGFIQMGMGVFFLALTVLVGRLDLIEANALKLFVVALYTVVALAVFQWRGLLHWRVGLMLGVSQSVGAWVTAKVASKHPRANVWAHRLLVVVVLGAVLKLFGFLPSFT